MRLIAHRGRHRPVLPGPSENTLEALAAAVADPTTTGLECDIRMLGDGTAVVFHDPDTLRLTGHDLRLADLDAPTWRTLRALCGASLPTLLDALPIFLAALQRPDFELHIEIKPHPKVEPALTALTDALTALTALPTPGRLIVSSFDPRFLVRLDHLRPAIQLALIAHLPAGLDALPFLPVAPVDLHLDAALFDGLNDGDKGHPPNANLRVWREQGRTIRVWTVDDPAVATVLANLPADTRPSAIITNAPSVLAAALSRPAAS